MARESRVFAGRALIAVAAAVAGVLALGLLWYAAQVLLVIFAGLLLAVALAGLADLVAAHARLPRGLALGAVTLGIAALIAFGVWVLADDVAAQATELIDTLPRAIDNVRDALGRTPAGRVFLQRLPGTESASQQLVDAAPRVLSATVGTTLGVATNLVLWLFIALYVAADPR